MGLTQRHLRLALWCSQQVLDDRRNGRAPVKPWNAELIRALELELATCGLSPSRQDPIACLSSLDHDDCWIGSREAARILGWNSRQVQRRAADLDGRKVAGKLVFDAAAVREYAEGLSDA